MYQEKIETTVTYPALDEQEKQDLRDNPKTWRVFVTKTITEEFVVDANTKVREWYAPRWFRGR